MKDPPNRVAPMKLLVGLGNPGKKYCNTRHNVGFDVVGLVAEKFEVKLDKKKFNAFFGIVRTGEVDVLIAKPQTFMNLSGGAVAPLAGYYKVTPTDILVVQDDIDMPFAKIKFAKSSGAGGHNGISSIIDDLGTDEFWRLKIGVGRPKDGLEAADHVLDGFEPEEKGVMDKLIKISAEAATEFLTHGPDIAMQKYNNTLVPA